jgi:hypothetical protein
MRNDMDKMIVERERYGSRFRGEDSSRYERRKSRQSLAIEGDEYDLFKPTRGIKAHTDDRWERKDLNENLNPLKKLLRANVGRPWSKVYSEICEHIRLDSVVQRHILEHLDHMVEKNIRIIDGKPYEFNGHSWSTKDNLDNNDGWIPCTNYKGSKSTLYVDPRDGILKFAPEIKKTQKTWWQNANDEWKDRQYCPENDPLTQYWKINNVWYELTFRDATKDEISQRAFSQPCRVSLDLSEFAPSWWGTYDRFRYAFAVDFESVKRIFGRAMLPLSKRQLNTKEARRVEEAKAKQLKSERIRRAA